MTEIRNKNVILISSMHNRGEIDEKSGSKQKPDVITYYNKTKCGVDCVDQMRAAYTVARCSCRWPLTVFFALMDIAAINSQIVYSSNHNITVARREFLKILSKSLTRPWLEKRLKIRNLSFEIINIIQKSLSITEGERTTSTLPRGLCAYCPRSKNRKTITTCAICSKSICRVDHTVILCYQCHELDNSVEQ